MTVVIGIPASAEDEARSPIVGDVVKKLAGLGARVLVQRGATDASFATPESLGDVDWADSSARSSRAVTSSGASPPCRTPTRRPCGPARC